MFEPEGLKSILTWKQQRQMLDEMKNVSNSTNQASGGLVEMKKTVAAFYVFQCYLLEFGTTFNAQEAVAWLLKASSDDNSHEDQAQGHVSPAPRPPSCSAKASPPTV